MEGVLRRKGWNLLVILGLVVLLLLIARTLNIWGFFGYQKSYQVVFYQTPTCGSLKEYAIPWGVRLGNTTHVQPPGSAVPQDGYRELQGIPEANSSSLNQTRIVFSVPNGSYQYILMPAGDFYDPIVHSGGNLTGTIRVDGHTVLVNVTVANPGGCGP